MNENEMAMACGVETFLESIGLHSYASTFLAKGYDRESDLQHLGDGDLDTMLISDPGHRRSLISAARKHKASDDSTLLQWLREYELEHYFIGFVRSELVEMEEIARLNLPDSNIYDELEISMPGHQRRLERAVLQLNKRRKHEESAEQPVTEGFWGKPTNLEDAKYDFLCVEATISSTRDASRFHTIDFMVDSGSDVTTLQEELLYTLNPELIGPINSKGVHSSCRKNLYRAKLTVGTQDLEIEVMGESYNSLGSRVLRHFRHYITGSKHIWLPGDFFDPVMSTGLKLLSGEQNTSQKTDDVVDPTTLLNETSSSEHSTGETSMDLSTVGNEELIIGETSSQHGTSREHNTSREHDISRGHDTSSEQTESVDETSKTYPSTTEHLSLEQKDSIQETSPSEETTRTNCSTTKEQSSVGQKHSLEENVLSEEVSLEQTLLNTSVSAEQREGAGETSGQSELREEAGDRGRVFDYPASPHSLSEGTDNVDSMENDFKTSKSAHRNIYQKDISFHMYNEGHVTAKFSHEKCKGEVKSVVSESGAALHSNGLTWDSGAVDDVDGLALHDGQGISNGLHS